MLEKPPSMPEGTLLKGIKRELLEVDVAYQKRDFVPYFTVCALLVYWVKFFVDLSGDDEVAGSLRDALETVAPFDTCTLQTNQFRRLFTYQFVHVNAGHLVANSIILLVLGAPLEMAHGPVVGIAFEAGVILGAMASLVFAPYQRVVGFSAGVYCVLGVHFDHLLFHWADMRRGALNRWTRLGIFFCFFGVDMVLSYAEQVSATIHLAGRRRRRAERGGAAGSRGTAARDPAARGLRDFSRAPRAPGAAVRVLRRAGAAAASEVPS